MPAIVYCQACVPHAQHPPHWVPIDHEPALVRWSPRQNGLWAAGHAEHKKNGHSTFGFHYILFFPLVANLTGPESSSSLEAFKLPSAILLSTRLLYLLQPPNTQSGALRQLNWRNQPWTWRLGSNSRIANEYICVLTAACVRYRCCCYQRPMPLHSMFV
ncbi:hypothetical protein BDP81DRAFT_41097 [Colletotrichum phormii]|uniref:Uncharacterized protein n=1 Tax=Colletotrichum phormii TaxID=359342 RepID=A0AAI9ZQ21_9PEZI|nr:uncharacterized protein BDP81DRAFT_41097 [Colletotrichum phormii]KAK1635721.1 hypothetical protein BDP81DRAFT_41097 [Colletotrichum phormii]